MPSVLVIEADHFMSKLYTVKLKKLKYSVDTVMNGIDALEKLKLNQYEGILMDLIIPNRSGFTILEDLKKFQKNLKAIVITTDLQQVEDMKKAFSLGINLYYIKGHAQIYDIIDALQALIENTPMPENTGVDAKNPSAEIKWESEESSPVKKPKIKKTALKPQKKNKIIKKTSKKPLVKKTKSKTSKKSPSSRKQTGFSSRSINP